MGKCSTRSLAQRFWALTPAMVCTLGLLACRAPAEDPKVIAAQPAGDVKPAEDAKPDASKLPFVAVDVKKREIRVECEEVNAEMPLEFFCCINGTAEHEAVMRTQAKPSHVHLAMLMLGLQPGEPVRFSKAADKWLPPHGPPLQIFCEWTDVKTNKAIRYPAYRMMRGVKNKKEMRPMTWIFAGSRVMDDGRYAADTTGYLVSVVNFDLTTIDIPELASNANDSLEWEVNPDICPPKGTKVYMVIEPVGKNDGPGNAGANAGGGAALPQAAPADDSLTNAKMDEQLVKKLRGEWDKIVRPNDKVLREVTQKHYEVIERLRREQNRLIDEADRVGRVIDQLQKEYQEMTTPRPEPERKEAGAEKN